MRIFIQQRSVALKRFDVFKILESEQSARRQPSGA
jgi:hypothetical protein